jgi:hypothetical protein
VDASGIEKFQDVQNRAAGTAVARRIVDEQDAQAPRLPVSRTGAFGLESAKIDIIHPSVPSRRMRAGAPSGEFPIYGRIALAHGIDAKLAFHPIARG